jgi:hypothetical protein
MGKGVRNGSQGVPMGSVEYSPGALKRRRRGRQRQEERWASRSGPVEISHVPAEDADEDQAEEVLEEDPDCE